MTQHPTRLGPVDDQPPQANDAKCGFDDDVDMLACHLLHLTVTMLHDALATAGAVHEDRRHRYAGQRIV
jgi:hypothetical protein